MNNKAYVNLDGAMRVIKKSKNPLTPIFEAVTNSLESILQRKAEDCTVKGIIDVKFYFKKLFDDSNELESIVIEDNGKGFCSESYARFVEFFDEGKGFSNRGSGRLQYFHRFGQLKVVSTYSENDTFYCRSMECYKDNFIANEKNEIVDESEIKTIIELAQPKLDITDFSVYTNTSFESLYHSFVSHFLLRLHLESQEMNGAPTITITAFENGNEVYSKVICSTNLPEPKSYGVIVIPYLRAVEPGKGKKRINFEEVEGKSEELKWSCFEFEDTEIATNEIYLCSKDIPVKSVHNGLFKKSESLGGKRYISVFYGDILNQPENVSESVDDFLFPKKKQIRDQQDGLFVDFSKEYITYDALEEKVYTTIETIYDFVQESIEQSKCLVINIAKYHGIPISVIKQAGIKVSDGEEAITKKLYQAQADQLATSGYKAKKIYESLVSLNPASGDYQKNLQSKAEEFSELIDNQNKEELSKYVVRREMVVRILEKILSEDLEYQKAPKIKGKNKDKEGLVHDLVFKRKSTSTKTVNDLWILSEEFLHFEGCSDVRMDKIVDPDGNQLLREIPENIIKELGLSPDGRPDIYLNPGEEKCLIVEFKEPGVDLSDYLNQMTKYCMLIANYGLKKITSFYCYLIGENISPYAGLDGDYKKTINGDWIRPNITIPEMNENRNPIGNAQIEIIKLSSIAERAHRRNLSFADKLGVSELLTQSSESDADNSSQADTPSAPEI